MRAKSSLSTRTDITLSARRTYRAALDRHLLPHWGLASVASIRRRDIATWLAGLGERLEPRSVIGVHRALSMVLGWAVETDRIGANPAARLPLPRPTTGNQVFLSHAEVEPLAACAGAYRPVILTLAYTGLRFGQAAALQVQNVDLEARRLSITQAWASPNTGLPYLSTPKTHERRKVGLPAFLIDELKPLVTGRPATAWLFTATYGGALNISNWNRRVTRHEREQWPATSVLSQG
jgi:integrase